MSHPPQRVPLQQFTVQLGAKGRLVLPLQLRRQLDVREGDRLTLTVEPDGSVRLMRLRDQVERFRGILRDLAPGRSLVDELIAERREEARREAGE